MDDSLRKNNNERRVSKIIDGFNRVFISVAIICLLTVPIIVSVLDKSEGSFPERFIGRDLLISTVNNFRYFVLGDIAFKDVIVTSEGWAIPTDSFSINDYQNTFPLQQISVNEIGDKLNSLCSFLTQNEIEFILIVPPNKNSIYPEYLPKEISVMNSKSRLDQIMEVWKDTENCHLMDLRDPLLHAKAKEVLYFSTDTHWNQHATFVAHKELTNYLTKKFPEIKVPNKDDYKLSNSTYVGDLVGTNFGHLNIYDEIQTYVPIQRCNCWGSFSTDAEGVITGRIINEKRDFPTAIIFHDSYINDWVPFLSEIFQEARYIRTPFGEQITINPRDIAAEKPDIVIIECVERLLVFLLGLPDVSDYPSNY